MDETVMYPLAYFSGERVELKPCTLDKFGSNYTNMFDEPDLDKFYCFPKFNYTFRPFRDTFYIVVIPCENFDNDGYMDEDYIGTVIDTTYIDIRLQDVMITHKIIAIQLKEE